MKHCEACQICHCGQAGGGWGVPSALKKAEPEGPLLGPILNRVLVEGPMNENRSVGTHRAMKAQREGDHCQMGPAKQKPMLKTPGPLDAKKQIAETQWRRPGHP